MTKKNETQLVKFEEKKEKFESICKQADKLSIAQNTGAAFTVSTMVLSLRDLLTDEIMDKVFMPLMNTKIGFLTDRDGKTKDKRGNIKQKYSRDAVRDCIIDAVSYGLTPTYNQFNILAGKMYPTKEGFTYLLKKIGVKYFLDVGIDTGKNTSYAEIPVTINYEFKGEKKSFIIKASVKKDSWASMDALRGKAEKKAKKILYEYVTGCDLGEGDEDSVVVTTSTGEKKENPQEKQNQNITDIDAEEVSDDNSSDSKKSQSPDNKNQGSQEKQNQKTYKKDGEIPF